MVIATPGVRAAQAVVTCENDRDTVRLLLVAEPGADRIMAQTRAIEAFATSARIRADGVEFIDLLEENASLIVNKKDA